MCSYTVGTERTRQAERRRSISCERGRQRPLEGQEFAPCPPSLVLQSARDNGASLSMQEMRQRPEIGAPLELT